MKSIGHARVPTSGQTLDAQLDQLHAQDCVPILRETMSGAKSDRTELKNALAALDQEEWPAAPTVR
ncbi:recombinase family protein [Paracoccus sp. YLB-12]|uniref:Recombinase family protein n=1 Tax=Paracoccus maritimus TaxID=2933292 RepID=A0ABT2KEM8_9RHOB|nr:recombinase family protein [Paracoccus sp. YLB-12]